MDWMVKQDDSTNAVMEEVATDKDDWIFFGYCPVCGEHTLYRHKRRSTGSNNFTSYARCQNAECGAAFYVDRVLPEDDYYRNRENERYTTGGQT